jgi:hypothetical protein
MDLSRTQNKKSKYAAICFWVFGFVDLKTKMQKDRSESNMLEK